MFSTVIQLLLLCLSITGYGLFIYKKLKIHAAFLPIFIFSSIVSILFFAGILNILPIAAYTIFYVGLLLLFLSLLKIDKDLWYSIHPSTVVFIIGFIGLLFLLRGTYLLHYDNFSHWGLVVREMLHIDGLPDDSTIVTFRNYPPGTALFIYFVVKTLEFKESIALIAQATLLLASLLVLMVYSSWKKPSTIILTVVSIFSLLLINWSSIYDLLVDIILGAVALSVVVIGFHYRDDWKKSLMVNAPIMILLVLIKDSAKLFVIVNTIIILYFTYKNCVKGKRLKPMLNTTFFLSIIPLAISYLWVKYTEFAYHSDYKENRFALTSEKITNPKKDDELISNIGNRLFQLVTDIQNVNIILILILLSVITSITIFKWFKKNDQYKYLLFFTTFSIVTYIIYVLSLYLMYVYMMPSGEAAYLAGRDRYLSTIFIYLIGILLMLIANEWHDNLSKKFSMFKNVFIISIVCILILMPYFEGLKALNLTRDYPSHVRVKINEYYSLIKDWSEEEPNVVYLSPNTNNNGGYLSRIVRYEQRNWSFKVFTDISNSAKQNEFITNLRGAKYLIVTNKLDKSANFLSSFIQGKELQTGIYLIERNNDDLNLSHLVK